MANQATSIATPLSAEILDRLRPETKHALPKVRQLYLSLYQIIESGHLPFDTQLPSSRILATKLGLGRNTVISVYEQLAAEGLLLTDGRRGTRIARQIAPRIASTDTHWEHSQRSSGLPASQPFSAAPVALSPGEPDTALFPQALWRKAMISASRISESSLGYRSRPLNDTCDAIARYLTVYRSLTVAPEQIIVTSSTRQSLSLAAIMYSDPGDIAWAECPGYLGSVEAFQQHGLTLQACTVDEQGLVLPGAWQSGATANPRLIYLTPCFQYPLGMPLGVKRREALLDISREHGSVLFEDDYDSEFRDDAQPRPALAADADGARVLHAGTFSKLLFPAVRVGWLVVPRCSIELAHRCLRTLGGGNNTVAQAAVTQLLDNGSIAKHVRYARQIYGQRRKALIHALSKCDYFQPIDTLSGSLSLVLQLKKSVSLPVLEAELNKAGLGAKPIERMTWNSRAPLKCHALVVGLGNVDTLAIPATATKLIAVLKRVT